MNLPIDITISEMQILLHQLWAEYLPGEDLSFVDQLDEGGLRLFFDFIGEKDEGKREKMRAVLEQTLVETRTEKKILAQAFIQKANKLILGYRESLKQQEDNIDLEQLESNF